MLGSLPAGSRAPRCRGAGQRRSAPAAVARSFARNSSNNRAPLRAAAAYLPGAAGGGGAAASTSGALEATTEQAFKRLQNGSDIRGVAFEGPKGEPVTLTPAAAYFVARGFVTLLRERGAKLKVALGCDPRLSGPLLRPAVLAGLLDAGAAAVDAGLATTPAMFYSIVAPGSDVGGAIMMTASHMPAHNNGLKFFVEAGGLEKADIAAVLAAAGAECAAAGVRLGDPLSDAAYVLGRALEARGDGVPRVPLLDAYAGHLRRVIVDGVAHPEHRDAPLRGFKIVVDAGNGAGGFFADQVLAPLGADVAGSQFLDPDGTFPNHVPNPEVKEAMDAGIAAVKAARADLGIVFDTDVDRSAIVDASGLPINSNRYIALMASITLREHPGSTVVTDSVTSNGLTDFIAALGGSHCRYKRGYKNVINKGIELGRAGVDCQLMMETSGHGALKENLYLDDGAHLAVKAIVEMVRLRLEGRGSLADALAPLAEPLESAEHRVRIADADFKAVGGRVLDAFHAWVDAGAGGAPGHWRVADVNHEGWRVDVDEGGGKRGWLLLRQSLHDPLLVLNVESDVPGGVAASRARVLAWLQGLAHGGALDLSALEQAA